MINLSAIAEKARDEAVKREERMKSKIDKQLPRPFFIEGLMKEDLNIVLFKDLAGPGTATI